ncbi:MAG: COX15/CtaA family protein [Chloroflexi bacterium]|nr:COX15/CtaA family protein [Chloroflexota bacterium]
MNLSRFAKFAWFVLVYNLGVIVWGAYVRATGSGAGCGQHWPLCNGEVIPQSPDTARVIEFSHRVSSGLTLLLVIALAVWAWRAYSKGSIVRWGAGLTLFFTITEALVGAGLVLFRLVGENTSIERALSAAIHLANTFLLVGALTLTAWWASGGKPLRLRNQGPALLMIGLGLVGVLLVGISGAVTALGDTLYPSSSLAQGLQQDVAPTAELLIRLRVIHPFIAVAVGLYVILLARVLSALRPTPGIKPLGALVTLLVVVQLMAGVINVYLLAPVWLQLVHLLLADLVWIALVLLAASVLAQPAPQATTSEPLKRLWQHIVSPDSNA